MTRVALGLVVAGGVGTVVLLLSSCGVAFTWRTVTRWSGALSPRPRSRLLAAWRLLPAGAALTASLVTLVAFLRYEPFGVDESLGLVLPLLFATGVMCVAAGLTRVAGALRRTHKTVRAWRSERAGFAGTLPLVVVVVPFPVVALVGVRRPRLFIARQVVSRCDRGELDAMIAHELAHVHAGDNVTRLLFAASPVVPLASRAFQEIEQSWIAASEEAADDAARRQDGKSAVALASALTKVAKMAATHTPIIHASAILSGTGVERRVRRLLEPAPASLPAPRLRFVWPAAILSSGCVLLSTPVLRAAYELAEYCVQKLP